MILTRQHVTPHRPSLGLTGLTGHLPLTLWQVDAGVNTYAHKHVSTLSPISPLQLKRTAPKRTSTEALAISPGMALL